MNQIHSTENENDHEPTPEKNTGKGVKKELFINIEYSWLHCTGEHIVPP